MVNSCYNALDLHVENGRAHQPALIYDSPVTEATNPLYILYTSGTTGAPKGVVRNNGGHLVALKWSMKNIYGVDPGEVYWAASDVGWIVGHSYIVYAPIDDPAILDEITEVLAGVGYPR